MTSLVILRERSDRRISFLAAKLFTAVPMTTSKSEIPIPRKPDSSLRFAPFRMTEGVFYRGLNLEL